MNIFHGLKEFSAEVYRHENNVQNTKAKHLGNWPEELDLASQTLGISDIRSHQIRLNWYFFLSHVVPVYTKDPLKDKARWY